ncbi:Hsp20/alpha crystallin family protein [Flaviaesturariibacter flavus]|uniref:Hsp20/alpha crystallin family protein n=1 Tax=Flaviaesturariibacter flavus TaxID=2502780 RepID=A0A4R1BND1_9BACT|nr:Hsp20/alpha crystallin family protein [Flaviaesturariibacter flavus]TCJ19073.1 Hsp20/alpha crystallin family protein [Flaviaesturariibacter flavus]
MATNVSNAGFSTPALFNDFFRPWSEWFGDGGHNTRSDMPAVNVSETDKEYRLSLAAPGLSKEDFQVNVEGKLLTIRSEKEERHAEEKERYTRKEYSFSSFSRSFSFPEDVQADKISAVYKDGILRVELPRKALAGPGNGAKKISIQ